MISTSFHKQLQKKVDSMTSHPGQIWVKTWKTDRSVHFKINDCEYGQPGCGYITHLMYHINESQWGGNLRYNEQGFILNGRQALALFEGNFDWMFDFLWIFK